MKNIKQYYKELGKLVYAVAIADGSIQPEERIKLHEMVRKELAAYESDSDSSGMNKAFYVDFEFEYSEVKHPLISEVVYSFNRFIHENSEPGDKQLLSHSIKLLESVSEAYSKKREKNIIEAVKIKIDEIELS